MGAKAREQPLPSHFNASVETKTPVRTALLKESEDYQKLHSIGSWVAHAGIEGLKSIDQNMEMSSVEHKSID